MQPWFVKSLKVSGSINLYFKEAQAETLCLSCFVVDFSLELD
jgi:hypothetical protein